MSGKICVKCGLLSERLKTTEDFTNAGWLWGSINYKNGANITFALCPECRNDANAIPYLKPGWAHRASDKAERAGAIDISRG